MAVVVNVPRNFAVHPDCIKSKTPASTHDSEPQQEDSYIGPW